MARDSNQRSWNKKTNPYLTRAMGIDRGKEERIEKQPSHSFDQLSMGTG
jgi:hypothetical protein